MTDEVPSSANQTAELTGETELRKGEKDCVVCGKLQAPYKCPTCLAKYCSVNCCKDHKTDSNCMPPARKDVEGDNKYDEVGATRKYFYPTKDTVPPEKLQMLTEGENLVQLKQYLEDPTVRSNILKLDACADPISTFNEVMEDERFVNFSAFVTHELNKSERENFRRMLDDDE